MNETALRLKAIIGRLKLVALPVLIIAAILLFVGLEDLSAALKNPDADPQPATVSQLVDGTVGTGQYVSVPGYAKYGAGYEKTEDDKVIATYYFLSDYDTGHLIVVEASTTTTYGRQSRQATVTGMTRSTESALEDQIENDSDIQESGLETTSRLYLDEGATPPGAATGLILLALGGIAGFLSIATFFFPSTVFAPGPLPTPDTPAPVEVKPQVKAIGRFLKLKRVRPSIEMGRGTRKFRNSVANIVPLAERKLMIYIHHILKGKYGTTLSKTHWGVFIEPSKVIDIEGGKLYGWKNRWAVRFTYTGHKDKPETLIVSFDKVWGQLDFVSLLQKLAFIPER